MAKEGKKTAGLIDDIFDFGFGLKFDNEMIDQAENIIGKDKKDMSPDERKKFREILDDLLKKKQSGDSAPATGKNGGMVKKMSKGGSIGKTTSKTPSKARVAGRLAMRGYGKAFKGK
jgi:non-homologous end joining protein Ku